MEFKFNKFAIFVFTMLFITIGVFGGIMRLEGNDIYENSNYDAKNTSPSDPVVLERTNKEIFKIPSASVSSDYLGNFQLWDSWSLNLPWVSIDFNFGMIFPDLVDGYNVIQSELSTAPYILQVVIYAVPIVVLFLIIRSVVVGV